MERLRAIVRTHAVDLHDDEADLGGRLHAVVGGERLRHERALRPGIDVLDHRVFLCRIEIGRTIDDAPDVGLAVAALRHEDFRRLPAGFLELRDVSCFQRRYERGISAAPQLGYRSEIDARVRVDVVAAIARERDDVVGVGRRVGGEARAVEVDPVVVDEVRILARIHAARAEPDLALLFVDAEHVAHDPLALGDLLLHRTGDAVIEVQVVPAVALRHPDDFLAVGDIETVTLARVGRRTSSVPR